MSKIRFYKPKAVSEPEIASQIEVLNARWFIFGKYLSVYDDVI